jgi:hypothetical protein
MAFATSDFASVETEKRPGIFARFFNAMVAARTRQAERFVAEHLLSFDEKTLKDLGYDKAELRKASIGLRG